MDSHADTPLIQLHDIGIERNGRTILQHVDLTVNTGDFIAITGPNGGGKTTLLRIILGLLQPTHGTVTLKPGTSIGYLPQKTRIDSHFPITVEEVVASGLLAQKGLTKDKRQRLVESTLESVGMSLYAHQPIGMLSGGQLQRTLLARAIISNPQLLVLDEPLSYLDKRFEGELYKLIGQIARDATVLLVSHEMTGVSAMANKHIIVDKTVHVCSAQHHFMRSDCDD